MGVIPNKDFFTSPPSVYTKKTIGRLLTADWNDRDLISLGRQVIIEKSPIIIMDADVPVTKPLGWKDSIQQEIFSVR